jgi:hypothetical protein
MQESLLAEDRAEWNLIFHLIELLRRSGCSSAGTSGLRAVVADFDASE